MYGEISGKTYEFAAAVGGVSVVHDGYTWQV